MTAINASIASKLVSQRNEVTLVSAEDTAVYTADEPIKEKLKVKDTSPIESTAAYPHDIIGPLLEIGTITINYYAYFHQFYNNILMLIIEAVQADEESGFEDEESGFEIGIPHKKNSKNSARN
jgi:hypothetical protein